ncbi:MAG: hypothetical protein NTZ32_24690 [Planctomycetales bacterium]|nr:hypothetical protein [Planctomycetales bacterium]
MMVDAASGEILGLAGQELFYRQPVPKDENSYQKRQRSRESEVWGRVVELVGPPAEGVRFVHVFDRGADNLDVFCHRRAQRTDWVIRAAKLHRVVEEADAEQVGERDGAQRRSLRAMLMKQPLSGTYELSVHATKDHEARTARMQIRFARDHSSPQATDEISARHRLRRADAIGRRNARGRSAERSSTPAPF